MKALRILAAIISIIALIISLIAFWTTTYNVAYREGFDACIEENNLYERYETNGTEEN